MSIVSYAQNFEDVMLWRALGQIANGFYIDVGAQHPVIDSVSKAFYERGWRGIHVEPTTTYATLLRQDRPDETVLQAALTQTHGTLTFYEIPETGLSTADPAIAERHKQQGFAIRETTVPCLTLADVFERAGTGDIHWLKIDVEGFERQVLEGWGQSLARPWIVIVESTLPLTTIESHLHWESLLLGRDYEHAYFDGLNRYYVSAGHPELHKAFRAGPNVFDGFALNGTASAPFCRLVQEHHKAEVDCAQAELDQAKHTAQQEITRLTDALATQQELHTKQEHALAEQLRAANDAVHQLESTLVHEVRASVEKEQSLVRDHASRVESLVQQLQASQTELRQLTQEGAARERELTQQAAQIREEVDELLRTLVQREKEFSQELMQTRQHGEYALADQSQASQTELRRLAQEGIERERVLTQQNLQVRQEMEALLRSLAQRESEFARELRQTQREAEQTTAEQARVHAELERTLRHEQAEREQALTEQIGQLQLKVKELLHSLAQRESEFARELRQTRLEAEQTSAEQARVHAEQERALRHQQAERDQRQTAELEILRANQLRLMNDAVTRENAFAQQATRYHRETETLLQSVVQRECEIARLNAEQQDRIVLHAAELAERMAEQYQLAQSYAAYEADLRAQLIAEKERRHGLTEVIIKLNIEIQNIHTSRAWRFASFLHKIVSSTPHNYVATVTESLPFPLDPDVTLESLVSADPKPHTHEQSVSNQAMSEITSTSVTGAPNKATGDSYRLRDLLAADDTAFVTHAYRAILRREPDPSGLAHFVTRIRGGDSKIQILGDIRYSDEGRANSVHVTKLPSAFLRLRLSKIPLVGKLISATLDIEGNSPSARRLRKIENELTRLLDSHLQHAVAIDKRLKSLEENLASLGKRITTTSYSSASSNLPAEHGEVATDTLLAAKSVMSTPITLSAPDAAGVIAELSRTIRNSTEAYHLSR